MQRSLNKWNKRINVINLSFKLELTEYGLRYEKVPKIKYSKTKKQKQKDETVKIDAITTFTTAENYFGIQLWSNERKMP